MAVGLLYRKLKQAKKRGAGYFGTSGTSGPSRNHPAFFSRHVKIRNYIANKLDICIFMVWILFIGGGS